MGPESRRFRSRGIHRANVRCDRHSGVCFGPCIGFIERVWATVAISGIAVSSVGVFQYHDVAFLDIGQTHGTNTTGTAGNPIFYGALLILMAPMSLAYIVKQYENASTRFNLYWLAALVVVTGSYTVSLVTTVSRGPMLG